MIAQDIRDWFSTRGLRAAVIGLGNLFAVRDRLEGLRADGFLDAVFFKANLAGFRYLEGSSIEKPRSLILAAAPRPAHSLAFKMPDRDLELILPPTYLDYSPFSARIQAALFADLGLSLSDIHLLHAPLKSLSAAAGLIRYGRNNIGYIPGWGSYLQLIGFVSRFNLETEPVSLRIEDRMLDACQGCDLCRRACPTGAISDSRFLLSAERCFTLFSESLELDPRPLLPPRHECLIGCLRCQKVCPENKGLLKREATGVVFNRAETEAMLYDPDEHETRLWEGIRSKFSSLGLSEDARLFSRNLRLLT